MFKVVFPQLKGHTAPDCGARLQSHRVRTSGSPQPSFAPGSSEGTPRTDLCKGLTSSDAFVNAWAERSCSQMCSPTADSTDVRACSPVSKLLVALHIWLH